MTIAVVMSEVSALPSEMLFDSSVDLERIR